MLYNGLLHGFGVPMTLSRARILKKIAKSPLYKAELIVILAQLKANPLADSERS